LVSPIFHHKLPEPATPAKPPRRQRREKPRSMTDRQTRDNHEVKYIGDPLPSGSAHITPSKAMHALPSKARDSLMHALPSKARDSLCPQRPLLPRQFSQSAGCCKPLPDRTRIGLPIGNVGRPDRLSHRSCSPGACWQHSPRHACRVGSPVLHGLSQIVFARKTSASAGGVSRAESSSSGGLGAGLGACAVVLLAAVTASSFAFGVCRRLRFAPFGIREKKKKLRLRKSFQKLFAPPSFWAPPLTLASVAHRTGWPEAPSAEPARRRPV
jgi:hypothetical protein